MKVYMFTEWNGGVTACFSTDTKRKEFLKRYINKMVDETGDVPVSKDDYELTTVDIDPDFDKWWNEPFDDADQK